MTSPLVRSSIRDLQGYTPGEQPAVGERVVKLNTNENPFPPGERVMQALASISAETLRRYPDAFRDAAAPLHGISRQQIIAGNGSDDILTIATRCFVAPSATLAYPDPTYSLYPILARLQDAKPLAIPWENDWSLPIDALASSGAQAIYLANPNAPSGTFVSPTKVAELAARFPGLVLVDEAYVDFADDNCLALVPQFANVMVVRTLSKAYSLAGLRFGYAVAQQPLIDEMMKMKDSYNCDAISIIAATAAIQDRAYASWTWDHIKSERTRVTSELTQLGWTVLPSQANFILAVVPGGRGKEMYRGLKEQGILVRFFDLPGLRDKLRITIGQSHENNALLAGIKMLTASGKAA
jgi:histidinol-phosphate aminotransferase